MNLWLANNTVAALKKQQQQKYRDKLDINTIKNGSYHKNDLS